MSTLFENKYYNTYYYSNIVSNILSQDIELLGFISNFFADEETIYYLAKPFEKESAFHVFIKHIIIEFLENDMSEHDEKIFKYYEAGKSPLKPLYAESALKEYGLDDYNFEEFIDEKKQIDYQDVEAYHDELRLTGKIEDLCDQITKEVFYIMFNNREVLLNFNYMVAQHMNVTTNEIENDDIKRLFNKNGLLKSENSRMVQKKPFFSEIEEDVAFVQKDLSGTLSINSKKHFDHIVPLAQGGLNDVSNIQLLCADCNLQKVNTGFRLPIIMRVGTNFLLLTLKFFSYSISLLLLQRPSTGKALLLILVDDHMAHYFYLSFKFYFHCLW